MGLGRLLSHIGICAIALAAVGGGPVAVATAAPANDTFSARQALGASLPIELTSSNVDATFESGEPSHAGFVQAEHSIWFEWEAATTELVTVSTCGSWLDTILAAYTGSALGTLAEVPSNRSSSGPKCSSLGNELTFKATAGTKYQLQVDGNGYHAAGTPPVSGEGEIELQILAQGPPANDDFANATVLFADGTSVDAGNWGATKEPGEPNHGGISGGASVWFKWTAPRTNGAFLQACGGQAGHESVLAVYTGASVNALSPVPPMYPEPSCDYSFAATAGTTYWIAVDGKPSAATGSATMNDPGLSIGVFPGNDDFETPYELKHSSNAVYVRFGNVAATKQAGEPNHAGNPGGASVWFDWKSPLTGSALFSACESTFRTLVGVYTGTSLASLQPVASKDDSVGTGCSFGNAPSQVAFNIEAGTVYRFAVDGFAGATGGFNIEMDTSTERLPLPAVAPNTRIAGKHVNHRRGIARFRLAASDPAATFVCRLDSRRFRPCGRRVRYGHLKDGRHVFKAKAVSAAGLVDTSPVAFEFTVQRRR